MKILSASQIREADAYTIKNEPVSSIHLMERAARACADWMIGNCGSGRPIKIFCGSGNNGGDGLAITRLLLQQDFPIKAFLIKFSDKLSEDCEANKQKLEEISKNALTVVDAKEQLPEIEKNDIVVDALFGTGLNRPLEGLAAEAVKHINEAGRPVISIDVPSGLFTDKSSVSAKEAIIKAHYTLSFQFYKLAFLMPENGEYIGEITIIPIGLDQNFIKKTSTDNYLLEQSVIKSIYKKRKLFSHKGNYGHALLAVGSYGKMGAALMSSRACIRAGAGLLTSHIPSCGYTIIQSTVPEAMCEADHEERLISHIDASDKYTIGIGPGIGRNEKTYKALKELITNANNPMVLDADALNIMSEHSELLEQLPKNSILTPHPGEFKRLFGDSENNFDRLEILKEKAKSLSLYIILKGRNTAIATPRGDCYFNITGNPGMATGGSGDVLTGMLTGILAQKYSPEETCKLGVYLHGLAGDIAAAKYTEEAMIATDIIENIGDAFKTLKM